MKILILIFLTLLFISNAICQDISCDLLSEEIARMKEKISEIENCVADSQMQWVNDICQKRPTIQVISTSSETDSRIALIEKCISEPSSRLIDGFCYYYYNGYETYEDAQSICQQHFEFHGFQDGRLYEPRVPTNHELVYKAVTEISGLPNPAIWIGIDDKRREGDFRYYSDSAPAPIKGGPMGRNQPNGTRSENCLTSFPEDPRGPKRGSKWWNRHPKWWDRPCSDKKLFMCEAPIKTVGTVFKPVIPNKTNNNEPDGQPESMGMGATKHNNSLRRRRLF